MLQNLSKETRECYRLAEECRRLAQAALTEAGKADYLDMERRWLSLAHSYEFAERTLPSRRIADGSQHRRNRLPSREAC